MRFIFKTFVSISIFGLSLGLLAFAIFLLFNAIDNRTVQSKKRGFKSERTFAVNVKKVEIQSIAPKILAYGEIISTKNLEIRSKETGKLNFLSDRFVEGGFVEENDLLFKLDAADFADNLSMAKIEMENTLAQLKEAKVQLELALMDLKVVTSQFNLRKNSLERQQALETSGLTTSSVVETSQLAVSSTEQTVISKKNNVEKSKININKLQILLKQNLITIEKANRRLEEANFSAPFSGVLSNVNVAPGSLVNRNEKLASLVDPNSLEVEFNLSAKEFSRILDKNGNLRRLRIEVKQDLEGVTKTFNGLIERVSLEIPGGGSGRRLFASVKSKDGSSLMPGDFVIVEVEEPILKNVSVLPATAVTIDGQLLTLSEDERLKDVEVTILRRQGSNVIVRGAPLEAEYVIQRSPQLGKGMKVKALRLSDGNENREISSDDEQLKPLSPERKNELIKFVKASDRMPSSVKKKLIEDIKAGRMTPKRLQRLEKRMERNK